MKPRIHTLGELKASGYTLQSPKDEMRRNLIRKIKAKENLFPGIIGFDDTVVPQLVNALLAKHDILLLGLRGQAKTRIARLLVNFLDEYMPIVKGSEINDSPMHPVSMFARERVRDEQDATEIEWVHRSERYGEKLATPDVSVADLIGDIDPIKAATQRLSYSHEGAIHYGIVPRTNRGIFVINELPDLQPRIQVALFNILQERDVQIRGFNIRLPLDMCLVFTANPEDYTNRGSIITPLKDRIDSQIITHYPKTLEDGIAIIDQNAWINREPDADITIPTYMKEIVESIAMCARTSEFVDQSSGVSARMTISVIEALVSNAERRAITLSETRVHPRIVDFQAAMTGLTGKIELVFEGEQEGAQKVARALIGRAVREVFKRYFPDPLAKPRRKNAEQRDEYSSIVQYFAQGNVLMITDSQTTEEFLAELDRVPTLRALVVKYMKIHEAQKVELASAMEFVIDALHQNSKIAKDEIEGMVSYKDMVGSIFRNTDNDEEY